METFDELDRALGTVSFDSEALLARAVTQGRRVQRRRRIAAGAAVAVAGALAVVPGFVSLQGSHGGTPADHPSRRVLLSPQQANAHLAALLPGPSKERSVTYYKPLRSVIRTFEPDGSGGGTVSLSLAPAQGRPWSSRPAKNPPHINATAGCHRMHQTYLQHEPWGDNCLTVPGGWVFTYTTGIPSARMGAVDWEAQLLTPDDTSITLRATNHLPGHHPTRRDPVLSMGQLVRLVQDPGWFRPAS